MAVGGRFGGRLSGWFAVAYCSLYGTLILGLTWAFGAAKRFTSSYCAAALGLRPVGATISEETALGKIN